MFEPVRGGTRGGQAEFKWSDVSADKDRENYLGHSINAPTGRWQKNKDVHWYNRDKDDDAVQRAEEIRLVKEAEADALSAALGFAPAVKGTDGAPASGSNATAVAPKELSAEAAGAARAAEKEEKRKRKAERKEEKRIKKDAKRTIRATSSRDIDQEDIRPRHRDRSRSRSPRRRHSLTLDPDRTHARRPRSPSLTPPRHGRHTSHRDSPSADRARMRRDRDESSRDYAYPRRVRD